MGRKKSSLFNAIMTVTDIVSTIHHKVNNIPVTSNPKRGTFLYDLKQSQKLAARRQKRLQEEQLKNERLQLKIKKQQAKMELEWEKMDAKLNKLRHDNDDDLNN